MNNFEDLYYSMYNELNITYIHTINSTLNINETSYDFEIDWSCLLNEEFKYDSPRYIRVLNIICLCINKVYPITIGRTFHYDLYYNGISIKIKDVYGWIKDKSILQDELDRFNNWVNIRIL